MKRIIMFVLLFAALKVAGQTTGYLRFDTVRIMKQNGYCELYIINKTKDSLGLLTNVGGGLTQFRRSKMLNDSAIIVGLDTLIIRGAAGGASGSAGGDLTGTYPNPTITTNAVTNAKLAQMAAHTFKGNNTGSTANASDLTATQLTAELNVFGASLKGLVPAAAASPSSSKYLSEDGTFTTPAGGGSGLNIYNTDSTLATDRIITQSGRFFRLKNGIPFTDILGGKTTILPDSGSMPYYIREIKSPFAGPTSSGILSWHEGIGYASQSPERPNYPYMRGWNLAAGGGAFVSGLPAIGESWEPHYLPDPGSPSLWLQEIHKFFIQTNGTQRRLESWTINTRDNDWSVYYTTPTWSVRDTNAIDFISASRSGVNVHNTTAGTTNFSISNGSDVSLFSMSPSTSILDYTGPKFRINGSINFTVKNGTSTERELISFEGDGGTTGYIGKYNSAWASQTHLQNGMVFLAANGTPTETMFLLKPGGTAWIGDLDAYNSGTQKVNISGTLALRGIGKATTAPEILVRTSDSTVRGMDTADFRTMMGIITANSNSITHTLDARFTTQGNSGTSETDLYSYTLPANKLAADGRTANFEIDGEVNDATATAQLKLYFAGNTTLNTGAVNISSGSTAWRLKGYVMRTSSTTAHVTWELDCLGLATQKFLGYSNLTSLDFTATNIIKITAQAGGAGGGTDDITAHSWQVVYKPQPQ